MPKKSKKVNVDVLEIQPVLKILVKNANISEEAATELRDQLKERYDKEYEYSEGGLYHELAGFLDRSGVTGDYNINTPEILIYATRRNQVA